MLDNVLIVEMPDGSKWRMLFKYLANAYFSKTGDSYIFITESQEEFVDMCMNNLNWIDVVSFALKIVEPPSTDYHEGWYSATTEIVRR